MADVNPFGAPVPSPAQHASPTMAGNPFDPMQQDPFATAPPPRMNMNDPASVSSQHTANSNPFGAPAVASPQQAPAPPSQYYQAPASGPYGQPQAQGQAQGQAQPQPQYGSPHGQGQSQAQYGSPQAQSQPYAQGAQSTYGGYPPQAQMQFGSPSPSPSPYDIGSAIVPSQQPTNPYAIVQATQQNSQWSVGGGGAAPKPSASSFDPFAPPPPPPPAPAPVAQPAPAPEPAPFEQPQQDPYYEQAPAPPQQDYYASHQGQGQLSAQHQAPVPVPASAPAPIAEKNLYKPAPVTNHPSRFDSAEYGRPQETPLPEQEQESEVEAAQIQRNRYSQELAGVAPPGASPLPKAELVRKKGFVLSRISFRTIVMKKWKQSFWVQYGPHTMLWFRSRADFDDWLNNPYHNQAERNFLIKLAVNFVHDLYKPNVRGYQVTQCRTKGYGKKMVRQFKLERWMDYGPTIAAAFGSYNPKEVDDLREALVECMRNTPLNGGIRATGAVRQQQDQQDQGQEHGHEQGYGGNEQRGPPPSLAGQYGQQNGHDQQQSGGNMPPVGGSVASDPGAEADLLDVDNWDDVPLQDPPATPSGGGFGGYPAQVQYPQQSSPYANAMVPVVGGAPSYPGAPPPPQQYQQQQQQYQQPPSPQQYQQQQPPQQQYQQPPQQQYQQQQYQQEYQQPPPQQQQYQQPGMEAQQDPWATPQTN